MCRSVLQTAQAATSSSTWPSAGTGSGNSRSVSGFLGSSITIARIALIVSNRIARPGAWRGEGMNEVRYAKYGAATGIVFVIFLIVGFLIVFPKPPDTDAAAPE